jgi:hypothetical protein
MRKNWARTREDRSAWAGRGQGRKGDGPSEGAESRPGSRCNEFPLRCSSGDEWVVGGEASSASQVQEAGNCVYMP